MFDETDHQTPRQVRPLRPTHSSIYLSLPPGKAAWWIEFKQTAPVPSGDVPDSERG